MNTPTQYGKFLDEVGRFLKREGYEAQAIGGFEIRESKNGPKNEMEISILFVPVNPNP